MVVGITITGAAGGIRYSYYKRTKSNGKNLLTGYKACIHALLIGGLTSKIGLWEGSRLVSVAIIIFVVAML
jgi:hypothetical protein